MQKYTYLKAASICTFIEMLFLCVLVYAFIKNAITLNLFILAVLSVSVIFGVILSYVTLRINKKNKAIFKTWRAEKAKVINIAKKGVRYYAIAKEKSGGNFYRSKAVFFDISKLIAQGSEVTVYFNPQREDDYFLDLTKFLPQQNGK
ncbi:hypothetical protein Emin_0041 [Elusimicrobium minutum Pei191]|uniref:Uncharacterized protein n=1 Tax=Elusimicrobium minutum (strain Pei191) TaxID=445932 RepID=B2KAR3_ELUMP|nr:hypothetical protein [Elusimicrobium minutum]ACC97609.1 hypothetical protein Emin_0041 [Elusimicrobium minutum Pei191]